MSTDVTQATTPEETIPTDTADLCPDCGRAIREIRRIGSRLFALPCWHWLTTGKGKQADSEVKES